MWRPSIWGRNLARSTTTWNGWRSGLPSLPLAVQTRYVSPKCPYVAMAIRRPSGRSRSLCRGRRQTDCAPSPHAENVTLIAGLAESGRNDVYYISQVVATPRGLTGVYRKAHLGPHGAGSFLVLATGQGCFPSMGACGGCNSVSIHTSRNGVRCKRWPAPRFFLWDLRRRRDEPDSLCERLLRYLAARAYDNSCYLVACNAAGADGGGRAFPGVALILSPKGELLARSTGWNDGGVLCSLQSAELERVRRTRMGYFLAHRRPELYGGLCGPRGSQPRTSRRYAPTRDEGESFRIIRNEMGEHMFSRRNWLWSYG